MAIATVVMKVSHSEARQAFAEYRQAVRKRQNEDDTALMSAYGAIALGRRVIDLVATMRMAGLDERSRPNLAIARADGEIVYCTVGVNGWARFGLSERWGGRKNQASSRRISLPPGTFPDRAGEVNCRARVPMIPPRLRPAGDVSRYHILWEAEWINAPKDPLLLRHLGRSFYAVVAQWDLTPLEQAILGAKGPA